MGYTIKTKPLQTIYRGLGLEDKGKVQQHLGNTVANNLKKYVSLNSGTQEKLTKSIKSGQYVEIGVLYAQFQAGGKVMVGVQSRKAWAKRGEKKAITSKNLKYHSGDRLRGAHPFERMKADKRDSILLQTTKYARGLDNG